MSRGEIEEPGLCNGFGVIFVRGGRGDLPPRVQHRQGPRTGGHLGPFCRGPHLDTGGSWPDSASCPPTPTPTHCHLIPSLVPNIPESQMQGLELCRLQASIFMPPDTPDSRATYSPFLPHSSSPARQNTTLPVSAHLGFSYQRWDRPLAQGSRVPCSAAYPQIVHYKGKPVLLPRRRRVPTSDSSSYLGRLHNGGGGKGFMMS